MPDTARSSLPGDSGPGAWKSFAAESERRPPSAGDPDRLRLTQPDLFRAVECVTPVSSQSRLRAWGGLRSPLRGSLSCDPQLEDEARGQGLSAFSPKCSMHSHTSGFRLCE